MTVEDLPSSATEPDSAIVRVLSYNIRSMRDDTAALARVIRACAPDLVLVQEAPRFFRWRKAAARLLQVSYRTLLYKIDQYHMTASEPVLPPFNGDRFSLQGTTAKGDGKE